MPGVTWFEDLSPYTYLEQDRGEGMLNVGWLEPGHAYSIGTVPEEATAALATLALDPQRRTRGFHTCGFCGDAFFPHHHVSRPQAGQQRLALRLSGRFCRSPHKRSGGHWHGWCDTYRRGLHHGICEVQIPEDG